MAYICSSMTDSPQYAWVDDAGVTTSLMNVSEFVVLRDGVHGFADVTDERSLMSVANQSGERFTNMVGKAREFGFDVMIIGSTHADLLTKRAKLLKMFAKPGRLSKKIGEDTVVSIDCYAARGSPEIQGGIAPDATRQTVSINLVAPDPYFYGEEITVTLASGSSTLTVNNPGTAEVTPCTIVLNADAASNMTTGQTMTALAGQTVSGATVTVTDNGVSAVLNGTNVIGRFTFDSEFWMLAEGINNISGVSSISFRPRWKGV